MRVLQINNTGVVPYTIKEYFHRNPIHDIEMDLVIPMHSNLDRQFQRGLKGVIELDGDPRLLANYIKDNVHKYDIIHLHALFQHLPIITEYMNSDAKIVYTGHGREVRQGWHPAISHYADKMTCVTDDLIVPNVEWIPNVPDPNHFKRKRTSIRRKALMKTFGDPIVDDKRSHQEALDFCLEFGFNLDIQDRSKGMYSYMIYPRYLEVYDIFFDFKYLNVDMGYDELKLPLSFTALQFLQLGDNRVIHHSGQYVGLPTPHDNYNGVMNRWKEIYEELL